MTDSKKPYKLALKLEAYGCLKFADKELSALCAELAKSGAKTAQELNADILKAAAKTIMTCADRTAKTTYLTILLENANVDLGIPEYGAWPSGGEKQRYVIKTMLDKDYTTYEQFLKDLAEAVKNAPEDKGGGVVTKPSGSGSSTSTSYEGISNEQIAPPKTQSFKDVPQSHWAYEAVEDMAKSKVITGYADGSFQPDKAITREEFVKILLAGLSVTVQEGENVFSDVDANSWYADYVNTAYALGIVSGRGDGSFGTGEPITRQDMAVMLAKAAEVRKLVLRGNKEMNFKDQNEIAPYALAAVSGLWRRAF